MKKLILNTIQCSPQKTAGLNRLLAITATLLLAGLSLNVHAAKGGKPGGGDGGDASSGNPAIVYVGDYDRLKVMDADGRNQREVYRASGKQTIFKPTWHPNGQKILFVVENNNWTPDGLYLVNLDGSNLIKITSISAYQCWWAEVSPFQGAHGQHRIAFMDLNPANNTRAIYLINEDGTGRVQLTWGPSKNPIWSPDGQHLAYIDWIDDPEPGLRIFKIGEDMAGNVWLENDRFLMPFPVSDASFGKWINKIYFIAALPGESSDLWALYLDEALYPLATEQLTNTPAFAEHRPTGSADDSKIVYEANNTLYVANSDGSNPAALPKGRNEIQRDPCFKK